MGYFNLTLGPFAVARDGLMAVDPVTPRPLDGDADTDARPRRDPADRDPAILDRQRAVREIPPVVLDRDAERLREVARPATEVVFADGAAVRRASRLHQFDAVERLQRANEHGARIAVGFGHRVHQVVDAVVQIHVRNAWRTEERFTSFGPSERGMTCGIVFADVRLGFNDDAGGDALARAMD